MRFDRRSPPVVPAVVADSTGAEARRREARAEVNIDSVSRAVRAVAVPMWPEVGSGGGGGGGGGGRPVGH
jgi:hypothetical protein